jgi:hypothetical protein
MPVLVNTVKPVWEINSEEEDYDSNNNDEDDDEKSRRSLCKVHTFPLSFVIVLCNETHMFDCYSRIIKGLHTTTSHWNFCIHVGTNFAQIWCSIAHPKYS